MCGEKINAISEGLPSITHKNRSFTYLKWINIVIFQSCWEGVVQSFHKMLESGSIYRQIHILPGEIRICVDWITFLKMATCRHFTRKNHHCCLNHQIIIAFCLNYHFTLKNNDLCCFNRHGKLGEKSSLFVAKPQSAHFCASAKTVLNACRCGVSHGGLPWDI
jgi:hypothetical protein